MLEIDIPGFGFVKLKHVVSDFTGTLSVDGKLLPGMKKRLNKIAKFLKVHVVTADTFGTAVAALRGADCDVHLLSGVDHYKQKEAYVKKLGPTGVIAFGNGNNDSKMLKTAVIGIAVCDKEGCAASAAGAADAVAASAADAFDLLLNPKRLKATLRY